MKRLFLASLFADVAGAFSVFAGDCIGKKAVFIPTASLHENKLIRPFYVGADRRTLTRLGMVVENLEISTAPQAEMERKIRNADVVFVAGGNTFFLLQELRRTGAGALLRTHIDQGKLYIGASAGSIVLSPDIAYAKLMDPPAAAPGLHGDFSALSAVDFSTVPHCVDFPFKKAAAKITKTYSDTLDLRPISNCQAITVSGERVEVITTERSEKWKKFF
ncbi:MAG: Type 1 glutamine amidotransferase-like domain-containing protein [Oscillospiraceae bacterium]|jgi:dipeptidase E|nr:Type 1 glutamine amidotransferase-like domain-containing protein [Oscillospiraceae bacterium]